MIEIVDRKCTLMRCWSFIIPALFFSIVTDSMYLTVLAAAGTILLLLRKTPVELSVRSAIYGAVIALTITILANTIFEIENRFFMSPAELAVPAAIIFAITLSFFDNRPTFTAGVLILCIFALMMCGDINQEHVFRKLPLPDYLGTMEGIQNMYLVCLFLCICPFFFLMNRSHFNVKTINRTTNSRMILKAFLVIIALAMVISIYKPTLSVIIPFSKKAEKGLSSFLAQFRNSNQKKSAFAKNVNLRNSFLNNGENLDAVLIRVTSPQTPGYLRSRVYEEYFDGSWGSPYEPTSMILLNEEHDYTHSSFSFRGFKAPSDKEGLDKIEIYYSGNFIVSNVLHTGSTTFVEMTCEGLIQTNSGTVSGKDIDFSGGLTLYNNPDRNEEIDPFPGPPELSDSDRAIYLQIDDREVYGLKNKLLDYFKHVITDKSSPDAIALTIKNYFINSFEYKLGTSVKGTQDPILTFLFNGKGHCELFATTTVMALRAYGIPARFVTGFYCSEEHPSGEYYIGRSRDLHAWVEYYDDTTGTWKHLEPTPPGSMPNSKSKFSWFGSLWDSLANRWEKLISSIVRGYFAEAVLLFLGNILDLLVWCFSAPLRAIISLSIIYFFFFRRKRIDNRENLSKEFLQLKKDFDKMLNRIKKIKGFDINEATTLSEIAAQVKKLDSQNAASYAECLKDYEQLRYCRAQRTDEKIHQLRAKFNSTLKAGIR